MKSTEKSQSHKWKQLQIEPDKTFRTIERNSEQINSKFSRMLFIAS